jgi:hypothetical protein
VSANAGKWTEAPPGLALETGDQVARPAMLEIRVRVLRLSGCAMMLDSWPSPRHNCNECFSERFAP